MTIFQLKRSMDRRFDRLERRKVDKSEFRREIARVRAEIKTSGKQTRGYVDEMRDRLHAAITTSAEETRRHFDVVAESMRDDFRIFADAIASHSTLLDRHERRISALERRSG